MLNRRAYDRAAAGAVPPCVRAASPRRDDPLDFGMPHERAARIAARQAFVEMKQLFMRAAEHLEHGKGVWLRAQVRAAEEPADLWLLRNPLLTGLRAQDLRTRALRAELYKSLDNVFPDGLAGPVAGPDRLPPLSEAWNAWHAWNGDEHLRPGAFGTR